MTNPLGKGTGNVGVNLVDSEKDIWARLAFVDDRSLGEFLRRMALIGLRSHNNDAANQIETIRRQYAENKQKARAA
jgi:hypothetical protein